MKTQILLWVALPAAVVAALVACNTSGLSNEPRATFSQLACLDVNGDKVLNAADAADLGDVPDFNGDGDRDADDAAFLKDIEIPLDPAGSDLVCGDDAGDAPEYLVAHGFFDPSDVSCDGDRQAVLVLGIGGGVVNLKDASDAAGVRDIVDDLLGEYDDRDVQTIAVIAGPAIVGARNGHGGMEDWLTHAVQVYLDRYPCLEVVIVGHSHGAVTGDVIAARLEGEYADRFIAVVDLDRVVALYTGDTVSRPTQVPVFNVYETNDPVLSGSPYESPNAENYDASGEEGPAGGQDGGALEPVNHTTIDNSKAVRERIVAEVLERSGP